MTAPLPHRATGQSVVAVAGGAPRQLDYSKVRAYWKRARPSMLGPYMMEGFGFPAGAGRFRFRSELNAVAEAIQDLGPGTSVLDLGSGVGVWTEYFAQRFAKVVAVEASSALYEVLKDRCSRYPNVTTYNRDVLSFDPKGDLGATDGFGPTGGIRPTGGFGLVFLGGLLMYLNDRDVRVLLRKLIPCLEPGALVQRSSSLTITRPVCGKPSDTYRSCSWFSAGADRRVRRSSSSPLFVIVRQLTGQTSIHASHSIQSFSANTVWISQLRQRSTSLIICSTVKPSSTSISSFLKRSFKSTCGMRRRSAGS